VTPAVKFVLCSKGNRHEQQAPDRLWDYGYLWDKKREHELVSGEAADVDRHIFSITMEGYGLYQIAERLKAEKIEILSVHFACFTQGHKPGQESKEPLWPAFRYGC